MALFCDCAISTPVSVEPVAWLSMPVRAFRMVAYRMSSVAPDAIEIPAQAPATAPESSGWNTTMLLAVPLTISVPFT